MLGAAAWYTMYQNQEQARESARQYAATIDEIRQKTSAMSLPETSDNEEKTRQALDEQNRLIDEQKSKIKSLQEKIAGYQYVLANPGWTTDNGFMINHMTSVKTVTEGLAEATNQLAVEQSRLTQMQGKAQSIQDVLAGLEERRVALIRQQAAEQNKAYQSLLIMNGQHTEFNRLLGLGNELLQQRQGLVNAPLRLPQATLDDKQQTALNNSERELALSRLKGKPVSVPDWVMLRMISALWERRIRQPDRIISITHWMPGEITRQINPKRIKRPKRKKQKIFING